MYLKYYDVQPLVKFKMKYFIRKKIKRFVYQING